MTDWAPLINFTSCVAAPLCCKRASNYKRAMKRLFCCGEWAIPASTCSSQSDVSFYAYSSAWQITNLPSLTWQRRTFIKVSAPWGNLLTRLAAGRLKACRISHRHGDQASLLIMKGWQLFSLRASKDCTVINASCQNALLWHQQRKTSPHFGTLYGQCFCAGVKGSWRQPCMTFWLALICVTRMLFPSRLYCIPGMPHISLIAKQQDTVFHSISWFLYLVL